MNAAKYLQDPGHSPTTKSYPAKHVNSAEVWKPKFTHKLKVPRFQPLKKLPPNRRLSQFSEAWKPKNTLLLCDVQLDHPFLPETDRIHLDFNSVEASLPPSYRPLQVPRDCVTNTCHWLGHCRSELVTSLWKLHDGFTEGTQTHALLLSFGINSLPFFELKRG